MPEIAALGLGEGIERSGDRIAAIDDVDGAISYAALAARADALRAAIGAERRLILLEGASSVDWLVAYVAGLRGRHPLLIAPAGNADAIARLEAQFRPAVRMRAATGFAPEPIEGGGGMALHPELAVMLSTSGSTGSTKCVRLSRANLAANAASIADYLGIGDDDRGAVNLPTHYSYGLSIVNSHLAAGATMLLSGGSVIDPAFWRFLADHGGTSFAGVPHVYDLLGRIEFEALAPASLRYFTQAGGRLPPEAVARFAAIAERRGWRFHVMYGQTEATARIAHLPPDRALAHPDCIGVAIPGGRLELIDADGAAIEGAEGEGELIYHGPNVMMGYAEGAETLADAPGPARLATGDIGRRDAAGLFRITGRLSRFVKIFGNRIGLDEVERLLADAGHAAIVTGIDEQLLVVTRDADAQGDIAALIAERLKLPRTAFAVRAVAEYPLLASGKVDYAGLKASIVPSPATGVPDTAARGERVARAFTAVFGALAADEGASFDSLGGDSINYIVVALGLEQALGVLPDDWEAMSIGALAALAEDEPAAREAPAASAFPIRNIDTLRGIACLLVVAYHVVGAGADSGLQLPMSSPWHRVVESFAFIRMPLMTGLAGYIFAAMPGLRRGLPHFIRRKARALVAPLLFVTLVMWVLRLIAYRDRDDLIAAYLNGYLHLWYIYALMLVFVAAGTIDRFLAPSWRGWAGVMAAGVLLACLLPRIELFSISGALYLLPLFAFGIIVHQRQELIGSAWIVGGSAIVAVAILALQQASFGDGGGPLAKNSVLGLVCGCAIFICLLRIVPKGRWLDWIGPFSYTIYLWHPVANAAVRRVVRHSIDGTAPLFAIGMAAGVFLPIALHLAVARHPRLSLPLIGR